MAQVQKERERSTYGTQEFIYGAYMGGVHSYFNDLARREAQSFDQLAHPDTIRAEREIREARGEQAAASDWFGPGFIGYDLGFTRIFSADLISHKEVDVPDASTPPAESIHDKMPLHTHFSAHSLIDIAYQQRVFTQVRLAKEAEKLTLLTSFLRPFAGIMPYAHEPYLYVSMMHLIAGTYALLDEGGEMFIELTYLDGPFLDQWESLLRSAGVPIERKPGTHVFKFTKAGGGVVPDFNALRTEYPAFAQYFETFAIELSKKTLTH
ncbi:MAG: hypothetical protein KBE09_04095 [Candidatus Pacebacteria bacterium]|nr:hypothetical protein [Candidatus Paceibacterota bacterium]